MLRLFSCIFLLLFVFVTKIQNFPSCFGSAELFCVFSAKVSLADVEEFAFKNTSIAENNPKLQCYIQCVMEERGLLEFCEKLKIDIISDKDEQTQIDFNECLAEAFTESKLCKCGYMIRNYAKADMQMQGDPYLHCMLKSNVTFDLIKDFLNDDIEFAEKNHSIQCYIQCILEKSGIMDAHFLKSLSTAIRNGLDSEYLDDIYMTCYDVYDLEGDSCKSGFLLYKCFKEVLDYDESTYE